MKLRALALLAVAGGAAVSFTGCAVDPAPRGSRYVISTKNAEFYRNGPAQDVDFGVETLRGLPGKRIGPDFQLPLGAGVTMLKREFGFSQIVTDAGDVGYISNDQLQAAPAITRSTPVGNRPSQPPAAPARRPYQKPPPPDHLDLDDVPLPLPG